MAGAIRISPMKQVPLSAVKDDFSRFLREAENEEIVITRRGKPAGVLIGFGSEDDWVRLPARKRSALPCTRRARLRRSARRTRREAGRPNS